MATIMLYPLDENGEPIPTKEAVKIELPPVISSKTDDDDNLVLSFGFIAGFGNIEIIISKEAFHTAFIEGQGLSVSFTIKQTIH